MKKIVAVLFPLICSTSLIYGQKTRFGQEPPKAKHGVDYPLTVHISGIHIRPYCTDMVRTEVTCKDVVYADAIMGGKKIELIGDKDVMPYQSVGLSLGDYQARLLKSSSDADFTKIGQKYDLAFPDSTIWQCTVSGISE